MCGIAGVVGAKAPSRVKSMLSKMEHRGPDGEGIWSRNPELALGHKRLAIVDLSSAGAQPMLSEDEQIVIVVNGEIYNYPELRIELEALGAVFKSTSDSEVVIHGWKYWGEDCFQRFNGMFALALYDCRQELLVLARDRLGITPLYFHADGDKLVFASEIKAIHAGLDGGFPDIDPIGLNQYLTYQNYFGRRSLCQGISSLLGGQYLLMKQDGTVDAP